MSEDFAGFSREDLEEVNLPDDTIDAVKLSYVRLSNLDAFV